MGQIVEVEGEGSNLLLVIKDKFDKKVLLRISEIEIIQEEDNHARGENGRHVC